MTPRLSICISTRNRAAFLGETLASIVPQLTPQVELVIFDGASTDNTAEIVQSVATSPQVRYIRAETNSGVDADYDKCVEHSTGEFCWLMTDDDLLEPDAISQVVTALRDDLDLIVANAAVWDATFASVLVPRLLDWTADREYQSGEAEKLFRDVADYLTFIGGVVVRRSFWMERDRASYYGSLFIHVGVLFQSPAVTRARVLAQPLIKIRYGNAMWTSRTFEIWVFKWPELVWSLVDFSPTAKTAVCLSEPWKRSRRMLFYRGLGQYSRAEYDRFLAQKPEGSAKSMCRLIAALPAGLANAFAGFYCLLFQRSARAQIYDLARATRSTWISRFAARRIGLHV